MLPSTFESRHLDSYKNEQFQRAAIGHWAVIIAIALLALTVRLPRLGERPMHTDEAVNACLTGQLLGGEAYHYDAQDRHGPALYFAALPIARFAGANNLAGLNEAIVRRVPAIWGALTILLFATIVSQTRFLAAGAAALLLAIGPLPVYYSRYFIHETLFVAATLAFMASGWRALEQKSPGSGLIAGASAGFMLACKETALLHFAAFGAAGLWWLFAQSTPTRRNSRRAGLAKTGIVALAAFAVLVFALYTWGGKHWQGPLDLIRSLPRFALRAAGEGHEKPFWYYLALMGGGWSGCGVLALAAAGVLSVSRPMVRTVAFQVLLVYTVVIGLLYSAIPYKTPWLALNLWLPISLLAGHGFAALWRAALKTSTRFFLALTACALIGALGRDTWQRVFLQAADDRNPYAYAHTVDDLLRLPGRLQQLSQEIKPTGEIRIAVSAADPWPLPWYLRKFPEVGYWQPGQDPGPADIYITTPETADQFAPRLPNWRKEFFGVRPEVLILFMVAAAN